MDTFKITLFQFNILLDWNHLHCQTNWAEEHNCSGYSFWSQENCLPDLLEPPGHYHIVFFLLCFRVRVTGCLDVWNKPISLVVSQLRWLRHFIRMPPGCLSLEIFWPCPPGSTVWGKPRTCWRDFISNLAWECLRDGNIAGRAMSEILCYPLRHNPWTEVEEHGWMDGWIYGRMDDRKEVGFIY